jgi:hypothetical protein
MFELGMLIGTGTGFAIAWAMAFLGYRIAQIHAAEADD